MRLNPEQIDLIRQTARDTFGPDARTLMSAAKHHFAKDQSSPAQDKRNHGSYGSPSVSHDAGLWRRASCQWPAWAGLCVLPIYPIDRLQVRQWVERGQQKRLADRFPASPIV